MRRLDELSLQYPFYGSRQMRRHLRREGAQVGRHRIPRLMRLLGLKTIYPKPRTSTARSEHRVYPYLLRGLKIDEPHQVWCADITYIPVYKGYLYLVAVINTLDSEFCVEALERALSQGVPTIFNTDQGAQFTSRVFTERVQASGEPGPPQSPSASSCPCIFSTSPDGLCLPPQVLDDPALFLSRFDPPMIGLTSVTHLTENREILRSIVGGNTIFVVHVEQISVLGFGNLDLACLATPLPFLFDRSGNMRPTCDVAS